MGYQPPVTVHMALDGSTGWDVLQGGSITWTDVTSSVMWGNGLDWQRGRISDESKVAGGSCSFTLRNPDGHFTPTNASGDYYPYIVHGVPVQIRWNEGYAAEYDADIDYDSDVEYDTGPAVRNLWTGTVDGWSGSWQGGIRSLMNVTAIDLVSRCERHTLQALPVQISLGNGATWCYPLDESSDSVEASDRVGNVDAPVLSQTREGASGTPTLEFGGGYSPGSISTSAESTVAVFDPHDATNFYRLGASSVPALGVDGTGGTFHLMVLPVDPLPARIMEIAKVTDSRGHNMFLYVNSSGYIEAWFRYAGKFYGLDPKITSAGTISTSEWTHIAIVQTVTGGNVEHELFINGSSEGTNTQTANAAEQVIGGDRLTLNLGGGSDGARSYDGNIANVTAHTAILSDTLVAEIAGGRNGWTGDRSRTRLHRVARAAELATSTPSGSGTALGGSTMCELTTKGQSAAAVFGLCQDAENAPWHIDGSGLIQMQAREERANATNPVASIPNTTLMADMSFSLTDEYLTNHVTASRPGGLEEITRTNPDSISAYGRYDQSYTLSVDSDAQLIAMAEAHANLDAEPAPRTAELSFDMITGSASLDQDALAGLDVGSIIEVTGLPATAPSATLTLIVEGQRHNLTTDGWRVSLNVTPASRLFWELGASTLGEDTKLGY